MYQVYQRALAGYPQLAVSAVRAIVIYMVSKKYSIASKKKWENVSAEEKKRIMSERGRQKWQSMTLEERSKHIKKMIQARKKRKAL